MTGKAIYCYSGMQRAMILYTQQMEKIKILELLDMGFNLEEIAEIMKEEDHERIEKESKNPE